MLLCYDTFIGICLFFLPCHLLEAVSSNESVYEGFLSKKILQRKRGLKSWPNVEKLLYEWQLHAIWNKKLTVLVGCDQKAIQDKENNQPTIYCPTVAMIKC